MQTLVSHRISIGRRLVQPRQTVRRTLQGSRAVTAGRQTYRTGHRNRNIIACSSSDSGPSPSADDSNSAGDEPSIPSTSYSLPWEAEQPALPPNYASIQANIGHMDTNQLQTALGVAIAAEDYPLASQIKDRLHVKLIESGSAVISRPMDWRALGVPEWLADRAERLGFLFPTEVQRRSAPVILSGADCVIASQTGSGKTAAFLVPALCRLDYPPELFPEDLEGPQLLLLVPSFELGVQACMLLYKLWGGNISSRTPGDPANMFSYTGPPGIKVRGVLNDEEVQMAVADSRYLRGVHALVATPDMALALHSLPNSPLSFQDLRAIVVDEVDALLDAYPASFGQLLDAAVHRHVPPGFQQEAAGQGLTAVGLDLDNPSQNPDDSSSSSSQGKQEGPGGQDNIAKLKALLSEQQQRKSPQQAGSPAGAGSPAAAGGSGSSASLSAAAARLEGLLAAPAATPAGEKQDAAGVAGAGAANKQQQGAGSAEQQQGQVGGAGDASSSADLAELAAQIPADYDDPMPKPQVVLVGATVSEEDMMLALNRGWVTEPVVVRVGAEGSVPAGLRHRAIVVSQQQQRLGGLVASLRRDLTGALAAADAAAAAAAAAEAAHAGAAAGETSSKQQPVRVIIFARSEQEARSAAEPLRAALWGDHMLSVLLPSTGAEPVKAITAFRDRVASLLLATPTAARGLDLPAVSHVYSLGLPQDATEYVHRAGRAGRIGSTEGGEVVTVVTREELPLLLQMVQDELGLHVDVLELDKQPTGGLGLLGTDFSAARQELLAGAEGEEGAGEGGKDGEQQQGQSEEKLEAARKGLEDLFNLL